MMRARAIPALLPYRAMLAVLAYALPRTTRLDWRAEWTAELWHVAISEGAGHRARIAFCSGAMSDVLCLRGLEERESFGRALSARACLLLLLLAAGVTAGFAIAVPRVQRALRPALYSNVTNVVTISTAGATGSAMPLLHLETVLAWQRRSQHLFAEFAFYQPAVKAVHFDAHHSQEMMIGRASSNLLAMLRVPIANERRAAAGDERPTLLLSESTWRSRFSGRMDIFSQPLKVGLETVRLGGVVPDETAPAGGRVDAWMLLPQKSAARLLPGLSRVFVTARRQRSRGPMEERWRMSVSGPQGFTDYDCATLSSTEADLRWRFAWAVLLAFCSLPALLPLTAREHVTQRVELSFGTSVRRSLFLGSKVVLVLVMSYFGSLSAAFAASWSSPNTSVYLQLLSCFLITLGGVQWCLRDQSQRCPVCLERLQHPARVGEPSRNFLAWNGTELICTDGHGLLHVPEIQTSWFGEPRWLMLDASWKGLFPRSA